MLCLLGSLSSLSWLKENLSLLYLDPDLFPIKPHYEAFKNICYLYINMQHTYILLLIYKIHKPYVQEHILRSLPNSQHPGKWLFVVLLWNEWIWRVSKCEVLYSINCLFNVVGMTFTCEFLMFFLYYSFFFFETDLLLCSPDWSQSQSNCPALSKCWDHRCEPLIAPSCRFYFYFNNRLILPVYQKTNQDATRADIV